MKTYPRVRELLDAEMKRRGGVQPAAKAVDINRTSYAQYLDGTSEPTTAMLKKIAKYFGTTVAYLRGDAEEIKTPPLSREKQLGWEILQGMTDDEALEFVLEYRRRKRDQEQQ